MKYPMKLMISGSSIKELADNARKFLEEVDGSVQVEQSQSQVDDASPFGAPPALPSVDDSFQSVNSNNVLPPPVMASEPNVPAQAANIPSQVGGTENSAVSALDSRGLPWDARIHASSKALTKDGSWRYKRGAEQSEIDAVEAELRGKPASQPVQFTPPPVPMGAPGALPPTQEVASAQNQNFGGTAAPLAIAPVQQNVQPQQMAGERAQELNQQPAVAPAQLAPIPMNQSVSLVHSAQTFRANMVGVLAELVKQGKVNQAYIGQLCGHFGVEYIHQVNDEQAAHLFETFVQAGLIQKAM